VLDDLHRHRQNARRALDQGRLDEATGSLLLAAGETQVAESDYVSVLTPLADILGQRGDLRGALTVLWYLASHDSTRWVECAALLPKVPAVDRGRTLAAMGRLADAAREMEEAGLVATAAIYRERGGDWKGARALWSRLGQAASRGTGADAYSAALVQCNLARCARKCGDSRQAHDALVLAVRLLEEAADHFETVGLRERAFDCFQVLIQLGREHESFEDVLEGFVNCVRILREDHLTSFALQFMDDAIDVATERAELAAAATLALEASQYARAVDAGAAAAGYVARQAELWRSAAHQHVQRGDPPDIAENALLASVVAFGDVGQFQKVGVLYAELQALDLPSARRARYAVAAARYVGVRDEPLPKAPQAQGRQDAHVADVWHVDLLEWEQAGSAVECCADVLLDTSRADPTRRKALLGRLIAFRAEAANGDRTPEHVGAQVQLAEQLAQVQLYVVLSPLERLWASPHRAVRVAVLSALQRLSYKRSFVIVRAALRDSDTGLVDQAATTLESLDFPHAFDPLSRVVREASSSRVRASAIKALSRVDTKEAAEFLMGILEHGAPRDREAAIRSLTERGGGMTFVELAKEQLASSPPLLQNALREILAARA
jgi:tetratricopeptide (TPR) repeat protein